MLKAKDWKPNSTYLPNRIYGIDFSAAKKAGKRIWIASAIIVGNTLQIEDCRQAKYLPDSDAERDQCLDALRRFISAQKACAFGLDFPFGLPRKLIKANSWEEFIVSFGNRYPNPEQFRKICWVTAGYREDRRDTDRNNQTPFSPYNRRLYRQTYYGIRDLLAPLIWDRLVCVLPMQRRLPAKPWLFEVCPASTLKRMGLYQPYKGHSQDKDRRATRAHILEVIEETGGVTFKASTLRSTILDDPDGDALDSVIAAFATFRTVRSLAQSTLPLTDTYLLEGYVYI
jgi:hypothetical protein